MLFAALYTHRRTRAARAPTRQRRQQRTNLVRRQVSWRGKGGLCPIEAMHTPGITMAHSHGASLGNVQCAAEHTAPATARVADVDCVAEALPRRGRGRVGQEEADRAAHVSAGAATRSSSASPWVCPLHHANTSLRSCPSCRADRIHVSCPRDWPRCADRHRVLRSTDPTALGVYDGVGQRVSHLSPVQPTIQPELVAREVLERQG